MSLKTYLCTLAIFCGGYVSSTLLDSAVEAAQTYFHLHTSTTYKTDSSGYIICSREKANDNLSLLTPRANSGWPAPNHGTIARTAFNSEGAP
jgi:hypothetical protein